MPNIVQSEAFLAFRPDIIPILAQPIGEKLRGTLKDAGLIASKVKMPVVRGLCFGMIKPYIPVENGVTKRVESEARDIRP